MKEHQVVSLLDEKKRK